MTVIAASSKLREAACREHGRYYTPHHIARWMLGAVLRAAKRDDDKQCRRPRILDPACGNGVFLLAAFDRLARRANNGHERLNIVRDCLFGVDTDASAIAELNHSLLERVIGDGVDRADARRTIAANVRVGDALTGPGFRECKFTGKSAAHGDEEIPSLDFAAAFPAVAREGGFDLIIGNPPYRRELNARGQFDRIASCEFGKRWKQARMDLWYYFLHRGLDLLRQGGRLSFIVNSYWAASSGARLLIERLERETTFEEIVLLGDMRVFQDVVGNHMIFRLRAGRVESQCRVLNFATETRAAQERRRTASTRPAVYRLGHEELFDQGRLLTQPARPWMSQFNAHSTLCDFFEVRQGMAENPPSIGPRAARDSAGRYRSGEGVFVLNDEEIESLRLSAREQTLLRSYFPTSSIRRYQVPRSTKLHVLYLTRKTVEAIDEFPVIARHLARFRPLLERRREVRSGKIQWWELHWPREERIFTAPRILATQMGHEPRFAYAEHPTFVGFSTNLILKREMEHTPLAALAGILNSTLAKRWFERHAKRRGVHLEINGQTLRRFPLPNRIPDIEGQLEQLVEMRQSSESAELDHRIDQAVCDLYGIELGQLSSNSE